MSLVLQRLGSGAAVCVALCLLLQTAHAQTEQSFDLLRFRTPPGQRESGAGVLGFTLVKGRSFCKFGVYQSLPSKGDPLADFSGEWAQFAAGRLSESPVPPPVPTQRPAGLGWVRLEAQSEDQTRATGRFIVRQVSFSGHGRRASLLALFNDPGLCGPAVDELFASAVPLTPGQDAAPSQGGPPALTARTWYKANASYSHWGSHFTGPEIAKMSSQGYATRTWDFQPDGRYRYRLEVWSMNVRPKELTVIEDHGRYHVDGDRLTVQPSQALVFNEDRDTRRRSQERALRSTPTVYQWRHHYLSGMADWYLVLAPADGQPTEREGAFDQHPAAPNAYLYGAPPRNPAFR